MNETKLLEFIQYYQRLTEECLNTLPNTCDVVFNLDEKRNITE